MKHILLITALILLLLNGCDRLPGSGGSQSFYIEWVNQTGEDIDNVTAQFGNESPSCGILVKGGHATFGLFMGPIPDQAEVSWLDKNNVAHSQIVEVSRLAPSHFSDGTIQFNIREDNSVAVTFLINKKGKNGIYEMPELYIPNESAEDKASRVKRADVFEAVMSGDVDAVKRFLDEGGDVNARIMGDGMTLLEMAAARDQFEIVGLLLEHHADLGFSMVIAGEKPDTKWIDLFLAHGGDVNYYNERRDTPLYAAVRWNQLETARYLIAKGADVNQAVEGGFTPLHEASGGSDKEMVQLLIDNGADVNAKTDMGLTPLWYAQDRVNIQERHNPAKQRQFKENARILKQAGGGL